MTEREIEVTIEVLRFAIDDCFFGEALNEKAAQGALDALEAELRFKRAHPGVKP